MKHKEIMKAITKLGPWYQRYKMNKKFYTTKETISGENVWPSIRNMLCDDLYNKKILDVGANAAYYSMMLALEGAEVTAIEPSPLYFKQAKWTKHYFEQTYNQKFPVKIYNKSASEVDYSDLGYFDYILALSVIYFIGTEFGGAYSERAMMEQHRVISEWCQNSDKVLVRTRNNKIKNSIAHYNNVFLDNQFYMLKKKVEKRPIILYGRLIKNGDYSL